MLRSATSAQNESIERLKSMFSGEPVLFTLVGSAACREYGLSRTAKDLDFVVDGYSQAMDILLRSGRYRLVLEDSDPTGRTCSQWDLKTGVQIDFLMGGIRITDRAWFCGVMYSDPLPIPSAPELGMLRPG
jgi:hypothetical protein